MKRLVPEGPSVADATSQTSARDRVRERRNARRRKRTFRYALVTLVVLGVLVGSYAAGFSYFKTHYYPGTNVAGIDAGGMTADELTKAIDAQVQSYVAHVDNGVFELDVSGSEVDLSCDARSFAQFVITCQDASSWPVEIVGANDHIRQASGVSFDQKKLSELVDEAVASYNSTAREPVAATLVLDATGDSFVIVDEKDGTALDSQAVCAAVADALAALQTDVKLTDADLIQPKYRSGDEAVANALERANATLDLTVPFVHEGEEYVRVGAKSFAPWLQVQDDLTLVVDQEAAADWAEEYVWQTADYSDEQNVYSVDAAAFAASLSAAVHACNGDSVDLPYITTPRYLSGGGTLNPTPWNPDLGRYIDVDKKSQTACLYDGSGQVLWEALVTTGNETADNGTPVGQFAIYDKKTDFMLLGSDKDNDGEFDYKVHVDYWMPFNEGVGLHDASWRTVFGGDEYVERGSGGCVNLSVESAAALYSMTHENEVVVVHE